MAEETEEKFQGALDLERGMIEDSDGRSKGFGTWTKAAVVADWSEYGELVVRQPHDSVCVADGALQFVGEQRDHTLLDSPLKLRFQKWAQIGRSRMVADVSVKGEFVDEGLQWSDLGAWEGLDEDLGSVFAELDPLVSAPSEFARRIHPSPWVLRVVYVYLCMTLEADRDCIPDLVSSILIDVIHLNFDTAKTVADATTPLASHEEICYLIPIELASHGFDNAKFR